MEFCIQKSRQLAILLSWVAVALLLTGCFSAPVLSPIAGNTSNEVPVVQEYLTQTPTATQTDPLQTVTPTPRPTPTTTPFIYKVKAEDTLLEIAWRFGITLQSLKEANPAVNPNIMSVGQILVIPLPTPEGIATQTRQPEISLDAPICFAARSKGLWCLVEVNNRSNQIMANIQIQITVEMSQDIPHSVSKVTTLLIDRLKSGERLPAAVYFELLTETSPDFMTLVDQTKITAEIISAQPGSADDPRYAQAEIIQQQIELSEDQKMARLTGQAQVFEPYTKMWIVAAAYAVESGQPVAIRRWEFIEPCEELSSGCATVDFDFTLYSLGPALERVEVFIEVLK